MHKALKIVFLFLVSALHVEAQVSPAEGSRLYYRLIGFSFPGEQAAINYKIEIATGNCNTDSAFGKGIIVKTYSSTNRLIAEVPSFGTQYTWRISSVKPDSSKTVSGFYHFSTRMTPDVDSNITRLRVIKTDKKYKDAYVFLDGTRVLYDMQGKPVWVLPGSDKPENRNICPRDVKATPQGTITFLADFRPYEISYSGKMLWHNYYPPNDKDTIVFHHEFTRLNNGHYMAMLLGTAPVTVPLSKDGTATSFNIHRPNTLIEYDEHRNVVWQWHSADYIANSDLKYYVMKDTGNTLSDVHENSFYFDEKNNQIYISFRNVDRVIKIKYPEGTVLNEYGPSCNKQGVLATGSELFCGQHSCIRSEKGYLCLFNNNTCGIGHTHTPTIVMMKQPAEGEKQLKRKWEYQCIIDDASIDPTGDSLFVAGGNVLELPDGSLFVSMGKPYCKVFIVNLNKEILWSAIPEKYNPASKKWVGPDGMYRASIILTRKELEDMIWRSEK